MTDEMTVLVDTRGCIGVLSSNRSQAPNMVIASYLDDFLARWDGLAAFRKPVAAAFGFALGGGCEVAR